MKIAVLGCGPAGLIAAHAALTAGEHTIKIYSQLQKSWMPGAQFLHERIPGVTPYEPDGYVRIMKVGTADGYAAKVYGDPEHPVSWNTYKDGYVPAWSLSETYDRLWEAWSPMITDCKLDGVKARALSVAYDLVISTIPAPALCKGGENGCTFDGAEVWYSNKSRDCPEGMIIYNGDRDVPWYRTANVFGHESSEYGAVASHSGPTGRLSKGFKPTKTTCNCPPENVIRMGRFGKWDKQVLVHHVYKETLDALHALS